MSSSTVISVSEQRTAGWLGRTSDYVELTKPRILVMVLVTVAISGLVATWGAPDIARLMHTLVGTTLVAASASVFNQWLERSRDVKMPRTMGRPIPSGRLLSVEAICFGALTLVGGVLYLALACGFPAACWAALTWFLYVCVYTPLKTRSALNTLVGAVPGALPVLIGWTGVGGAIDLRGVNLFLLVFLWQFPHFMAIAWLYRRQYAEAGMSMATVVDPTGRAAGVQAVLAALSLLLVSLIPLALVMSPSAIYLIGTFVLGVGQLVCAIRFMTDRCDVSARRLLRASLIYLPLQLSLVTLLTLAWI